MERLYAELADPDNLNWQHAQADVLRAWSKSGSASMDLLLKRGEAALDAGDFIGAIEHFTALTDHAPDFAQGWTERAAAYYLAGEVGPAIADLRRALGLNSHDFTALNGLGTILRDVGRTAEAAEVFRASLAIHPHQEDVRQALDLLERETEGTEL
ncbi:MAG: tetratricopeptide repeat protein [Defluviimonas sp.]|uniref:tetratricopeptide repeat protein n=1 Tax=Albidovulum sp. TaxID=1872424 RepID=UPI002A25C382|nr:tetratricopeptide repeat protein [Defluviimonas sp.]